MSPAERRTRRALAAYPWRVRAEQADEIVATVLDALPPHADRLPWRDQVDLIRGGLRTRLQRRPPALQVARYRIGGTLAPEWRAWVWDDVEDPRFRRHELMRRVLYTVAVAAVAWGLGGLPGTPWWVFPFVLVPSFGDLSRRQAAVRRRHDLPPLPAAPALLPGTWARRSRPRMANVALVPLVAGLGVALAVAGPLALLLIDARGGDGPVEWMVDDALVLPGPDIGPLFVGGVMGMSALVLLVDITSRPRGSRPDVAPVAPSPALAVATGSVPAVLFVAAAIVVPLRSTTVVAAVAGAACSLGVLLVGVAAFGLLVQRSHPVGLWDVWPRLGFHPPTGARPAEAGRP